MKSKILAATLALGLMTPGCDPKKTDTNPPSATTNIIAASSAKIKTALDDEPANKEFYAKNTPRILIALDKYDRLANGRRIPGVTKNKHIEEIAKHAFHNLSSETELRELESFLIIFPDSEKEKMYIAKLKNDIKKILPNGDQYHPISSEELENKIYELNRTLGAGVTQETLSENDLDGTGNYTIFDNQYCTFKIQRASGAFGGFFVDGYLKKPK